jgi:hypothetical protein
LLGNGDCINFWLDSWCGDPIVHSLNILVYLHYFLSSTVNQFLVHNRWLIPPILVDHYPQLPNLISKVSIPIDSKPDELMWNSTTSGLLSLKDGYFHQDPTGQNPRWSNIIWNILLDMP